ncbi:MAG: ATP-binding protein [Myxococcota bacterium]|jgi:ligand-binding sensor domain-containing protein/signal transduction histidine kinase|nr:ATP-binding protein [Myxococcota bacterium]
MNRKIFKNARLQRTWRKGELPWGAMILGAALLHLFAGPVFGLDAKKKVRHYVKSIYDEKNGLPQASVLAIAQTPDGYYWLGTQEGLARFDGMRFEIFDATNTPALVQDDISDLYLDRSAELWISTRGGGVVRTKGGRFEALTKRNGLIDDNVMAVFEDSKGRHWFATNEGCTVMEPGGKLWNLTTKDGLPKGSANDVVEDREGHIWIATEKGLVRWKEGAMTLFDSQTEPALSVSDVRTLALDSAGTLWVGTWGGGLVRVAGGKFEKVLSDRPKQMVVDIVEDRDKNLWVALYDGGIGRVEDRRLVAYGKAEGLPTEIGAALFEDREGNLLLGLGPGGLVVMRDAPFTTYDTRDGLPDPSIRTVYQDRAGDTWIGLQSDGLAHLRDGVISVFGPSAGIAGGTRSILERPEGGLYVASLKEGVYIFEQGRVTGMVSQDGQAVKNSVRAMLRTSDGSVWFGSLGQGLVRQRGGEVEIFTAEQGLANNRVLSLAEGPDGTLWIGSWAGGLTRYRKGRFEILKGPEVLESQAATALLVDAEGTVWVGTYGFGLVCYRDGRFTLIRRSEGLADDSAYVLLEQGGYLWGTGNRGIYRVPKKQLVDFVDGRIKRVHSELFDESDGLKSRECNGGAQPAGWKSQDGRLWFPTVAGLAVVDPDAIAAKKFVSPALMTRMLVNEKEAPLKQNLQLGPVVDKLEIHYTAPTLTNPEEVTFRFRLAGFETDWVNAGPRREAYYTNLSPGSYRFEVIPVNANGLAGKDAATLTFEIVPAFWQTLWFRIALVMAAMGLVWAFVMLRLRAIKQRNLQLEAMVVERTAELVQAHARIVKLEKESIEKKMAGGFAHEIRNALFSAKLLLGGVFTTGSDPKAEGLHETNTHRLTDLFKLLRSKLDKDSLLEAAGIIKKLNTEEKRVEQALSRTLVSVERSLGVTQLILEYSEIANKKPRTEPVPLHAAMAKILEERRARIEELGIEVELNVPEHSAVLCDEAHLVKIFGQLISNAIDTLEKVEPSQRKRRIEIREVQASDQRIVEVSDTGEGMTEKEQQRIFEPFYTTRPNIGTGLGLGMAAKYLSLYQGHIEVSSELGVGSHFSVIFPQTNDPTPSHGIARETTK